MQIVQTHKTDDPKRIVPTKTKKRQIILGHTGSSLDDFIAKITNRFNGKYDRLPAYLIALDGTVYELYDPNFYSHFMEDETVDKWAIPVVLENVGWVTQDPRDNIHYDWKGHEYVEAPVHYKEWRGKKFWAAYTNPQSDRLIELIDHLCDEHKIPKAFVGDNVTMHKPKTFRGVITRSSYDKKHYDLSPAMDFEELNERINELNTK